ncbi:chitobiase, partial [human gut metagenome]
MTVLQNCMLCTRKVLHISKEEAFNRAITHLKDVGMAPYINAPGAPKTIDASAVTSEALPGAIRLNWTVPADSTFSYMKISYVNPANQENVTNVVSIHTRTLLIENTLKKYGDYTFTFQAFN